MNPEDILFFNDDDPVIAFFMNNYQTLSFKRKGALFSNGKIFLRSTLSNAELVRVAAFIAFKKLHPSFYGDVLSFNLKETILKGLNDLYARDIIKQWFHDDPDFEKMAGDVSLPQSEAEHFLKSVESFIVSYGMEDEQIHNLLLNWTQETLDNSLKNILGNVRYGVLTCLMYGSFHLENGNSNPSLPEKFIYRLFSRLLLNHSREDLPKTWQNKAPFFIQTFFRINARLREEFPSKDYNLETLKNWLFLRICG